MAIYEITPHSLKALHRTDFAREGLRERTDLQRLLKDQIEVLDPDLLLIREEFDDWDESRRRIDLLAIDRDANLVVIELKRDESGGHMELQALRYAAMVSTMTFEDAVNTYRSFLQKMGRDDDPESSLLRVAILRVVQALVQSGHAPEEFWSLEGMTKGNFLVAEGDFKEEQDFIKAVTQSGENFKPIRWFTASDQLLHHDGRTYALVKNIWYRSRCDSAMSALAGKYPGAQIQWTETESVD